MDDVDVGNDGPMVSLAKGRNAFVIQTLIFYKKGFKKSDDAVKWASDHGMKSSKIDEKEETYHIRQRDPNEFVRKSMRTIVFSDHIHAVVGRLRHLRKPEGGPAKPSEPAKPAGSLMDRILGYSDGSSEESSHNNERSVRNDDLNHNDEHYDPFADDEAMARFEKIRHKKGAMVAQTLMFDKKKFPSADSVQEWANQNGYTASDVKDSGTFWTVEQYDTGKFDKKTFRTIDFGKPGSGVKGVIGATVVAIRTDEGIDPIDELSKKVERSATLLEQLTEGFKSLVSAFSIKRDANYDDEEIYVPYASGDDSHVPPDDVRAAAELGLELRRQFNRGGTMVGVARARDLSNGTAVSTDTIKRMNSYFARHEVDKKADGWGDKEKPSAGWIAWLLWGGDPGEKWARAVRDSLLETRSATSEFSSDIELVPMESDIRFGEGDYESIDASIISFGEDDPNAEGNTEGEPWIERNARLFRTGTHKGIEFTEQHIDNMVNTFVPPTSDRHWTVPLQLNHELDARQTIGHVRKVWRNGPALMGRLRVVGDNEIKNVKGGKWTRLSVGIRRNYSLMEVSVVPLPHIQDACVFDESAAGHSDDGNESGVKLYDDSAVAPNSSNSSNNDSVQSKVALAAEGSSAVVTAAASSNSGTQSAKENKEEKQMSNEAKETAVTSAVTAADPTTAAAESEAVVTASAETAETPVVEAKAEVVQAKVEEKAPAASFSQDGLEELKRQLYAEFDAKTRAMEERMAKQESVIRYQEALDTVMSFIETGVTIPAQKDKELEFVVKLMEVGDPELVEKYKEIKSLAQPIVKFGRLSSADIRKPAAAKADLNPDDIEQEALAMLSEAGFSRNADGKFSRK